MEHYFDIGGSTLQVTDETDLLFLEGTVLNRFSIPAAPADFCICLQRAETLEIPQGTPVFEDPERRVYRDGECVISLVGSKSDPQLRMERRGRVSHVLIRQGTEHRPIYARQLLQAMEAEHLIVESGGIFLHASFICHEGEAILFTAPSGTGKSTQAGLWEKFRGAQVINGDRCVIRRGNGGRFEALGVPFCGSSGISQPAQIPLKAIVVLSQAPENTIVPLLGIRGFRALWEGCGFHTWSREAVSRCAQAVTELISEVPIYHLACTPDIRAVECLETSLKN